MNNEVNPKGTPSGQAIRSIRIPEGNLSLRDGLKFKNKVSTIRQISTV
jgi:hypothetical protein